MIEKPYRTVNRKEYFTDEVKRKLSEQRKDKHRYKRNYTSTPFTGLIECENCGNTFTCLKRKLKLGETIGYLSCRTNRSECPNALTILSRM